MKTNIIRNKGIRALAGFLFCAISLNAQETIVHDPVAIQTEDAYYLFCTGRGIGSYRSEDLKEWTPQPPVFEQKPEWTDTVVPGFENHIWAPDIILHEGLYYLYYSVSSFAKNTSAIGVATNPTLDRKDPEFKWTDHGIVVRSVPNRDLWNAIDPNVILDEEGTPWMAFGSFWEGLKMVKLDPDMKSLAQPEEWHTIARRERSFELPDADPGDAALEAPFIYKKNGYYYLFLSWDLCCRGENSTYKMVVGRSENITGPYVDKDGVALSQGGGTLLLEGTKDWFGVGHNSVYNFDGNDYMFFHAYNAHEGGRPELKVTKLNWDEDQWPVVNKDILKP